MTTKAGKDPLAHVRRIAFCAEMVRTMFQAGIDAFLAGKTKDANLCPLTDSQDWHDWNDGWDLARWRDERRRDGSRGHRPTEDTERSEGRDDQGIDGLPAVGVGDHPRQQGHREP